MAAPLPSLPESAMWSVPADEPLLEVSDLVVEYASDEPVRAVDKVSLRVGRGEFVGIVGESGCGKSTLLYAISSLLTSPARVVSGSVTFKGHQMTSLTEDELRQIRWRDLSVVMQSAMNALNPVLTIGAQLRDAMAAHEKVSPARLRERSEDVLRLVGIDPIHLRSYPHQLSGGMRQRAMIAMALVFKPDLVIMDEPTSALDVVAQRSLILRVKQLQREIGFAVLFVTHDMSLVSHLSDRLAIMYAGQIAELGPTREVFSNPRHPYSQGLLQAFPSIRGPRRPLTGIPGSPPDLRRPPTGCRFHPRCGQVMEVCSRDEPRVHQVGDTDLVRCHLYEAEA
ncbi:ABC transporter ATP-binding protein [Actinopolymorpha alba]|uniref:ABC transporter ATP-binding protein n=1 Tax=Actinopolymorpha alba TaxID=533267 RepID=UPI00036EBE47|nr:ABC transporter ATP-binding protein [Actinopolymorpha alba]